MPRGRASSTTMTDEPRRSGRHSGAANSFLSLDMYSSGRTESNVKAFDASHNHNGVPVEHAVSTSSQVSATPSKRRAQTVAKTPQTASLKRPKREPAMSESDDEEEEEEEKDVKPPIKRRGRKSGATTPSGRKSTTPKAPRATPTPARKPRGKSQAPKAAAPKKLATVKTEPVDEDDEVVPTPPKRPRGKSVAAAVAAAFVQPEPQPATIRSVLDKLVTETNPGVSAKQKKEMASTLEKLIMVALNASSHVDATDTIKQALSQLEKPGPPTDIAGLKKGLAEMEEVVEQLSNEKRLLMEAKEAAVRQMGTLETDNEILKEKVAELEEENEQLKEAAEDAEAVEAPGTGSSSSSSNNALINRFRFPPPAQVALIPNPPAFDASNLPRGSAIGHSTMQGRADELIQGLANIAGMENSMASVAVTAATMPHEDENGEIVQRTVRTRVERIAVTGDMDLDELRAMGFEVVPQDDSDDEDGYDDGAPAIREMDDEGRDEEDEDGHDHGYGHGDGPLIDEAD